jgi:hypothetical protein
VWECEHGPGFHDGGVPLAASAPAQSRAWLLIEHDGRWAEQAARTPLPGRLGDLAAAADALGIRVQLIRRPGRRAASRPGRVFAAWTAGPQPWLADVTGAAQVTGAAGEPGGLGLAALAAGERPPAGNAAGPMYLVCAHGSRNRCCARFGGPLARALAGGYPEHLWETTHLGGHKFAANMVLLPHGLYYGQCDRETAAAAIEAYRRGEVLGRGFRGRAGQDPAAQRAEHAELAARGRLPLRPA